MNWRRIPPPPTLPHVQAYLTDTGCSVFVGYEDGRWHLSIAHPDRYPAWDEIKEARYKLLPDHVTVAMLLPPREQYVNVHPNCFHLWEVRDICEVAGLNPPWNA